jgi:putative ABC transport system permease protein
MALLRRSRNLFRHSQIDAEIADELRAHIEMRMDEGVARGMSPEVARREALLRFGNPVSTRERVTAADGNSGAAAAGGLIRY